MDKNASTNSQHIFHPTSLLSHPLGPHHALNHAHYLHRMSRCQDSMFSPSDAYFAAAAAAAQFKNPFHAAFEGLHQELGSRSSSFPLIPPTAASVSSSPPHHAPSPSRSPHVFYPNVVNSVSAASTANTGHRSKAKICGVCGDRAKSYHFGGISCDSCKAFFRRSVQNDAYKNFHCPYEGQCDINITSRKCCQYCRFKKCLSIGMEKSWVMTEEERLQMLKSRLERRQRPDTEERGTASSTSFPGNHSTGSSSPTASSIGSHISSCNSRSLNSLKRLREQYVPRVDTVHRYLSEAEVLMIETIINQYIRSCQEIPMNLEGFEDPEDVVVDNKVTRTSFPETKQQSSLDSSPACGQTCSSGITNSNLGIHSANKADSDDIQPPRESTSEVAGDEEDKNPDSAVDDDDDEDDDGTEGKSEDRVHHKYGPDAARNQNSHQNHSSQQQVTSRSVKEAGKIGEELKEKRRKGDEERNKIRLHRMLHVLFTCIQQIASFAIQIPSFQLISAKDQEILLRGSVLEMCFIRSGFRFDPQHDSWPDTRTTSCINTFSPANSFLPNSCSTADHQPSSTGSCRNSRDHEAADLGEENWYRLKRMKLSSSSRSETLGANPSNNFSHNSETAAGTDTRFDEYHNNRQPDKKEIQANGNSNNKNRQNDLRGKKFVLSASDIKPFMSEEMFAKHMHFIRSIRELDADEVTIILLSIIILLNPDRIGLQDPSIVAKEQEKFLILLRSYMNWRFGDVVSPILFGKIFLKLPDLKELSEVLSECQLCLGEEEAKQVYHRLNRLSLSPVKRDEGNGTMNEKTGPGSSFHSKLHSTSSFPSSSSPPPHHSSSSSSPTSSSSSSTFSNPSAAANISPSRSSRPWIFRIDAIPPKSLSQTSQREEDASRSCSSSPVSESNASTDGAGPYSPS